MRESKKAREEREARELAEKAAAELVWHYSEEGQWRRRVGLWWLVLNKHYKPRSSTEFAYVAALGRSHFTGSSGTITVSGHLGDVKGADLDEVKRKADAWLVEMTRPLAALQRRASRCVAMRASMTIWSHSTAGRWRRGRLKGDTARAQMRGRRARATRPGSACGSLPTVWPRTSLPCSKHQHSGWPRTTARPAQRDRVMKTPKG